MADDVRTCQNPLCGRVLPAHFRGVYCGRACTAEAARERRESVKPRDCARQGCPETVPWVAGQTYERWLATLYHSRQCARLARDIDYPRVKPCANPSCSMSIRVADCPSWNAYRKRKACSPECVSVLKGGTVTRAEMEQVKKTCVNPVCSAEFGIRDDERVSNFRKRKYCSVDCYREYGRTLDTLDGIETRTCALSGCSVAFSRPSQMARHRFKKKMYCSVVCANKARTHIPEDGRVGDSRGRSRLVSYEKKRKVEPGYDKQGRKLSVFGDPVPAEVWRPGVWRNS